MRRQLAASISMVHKKTHDSVGYRWELTGPDAAPLVLMRTEASAFELYECRAMKSSNLFIDVMFLSFRSRLNADFRSGFLVDQRSFQGLYLLVEGSFPEL